MQSTYAHVVDIRERPQIARLRHGGNRVDRGLSCKVNVSGMAPRSPREEKNSIQRIDACMVHYWQGLRRPRADREGIFVSGR